MNVLKTDLTIHTAAITLPPSAYVIAGISTEQDIWHNKYDQVSYDLSQVMKNKLAEMISPDRWEVKPICNRIALLIKSHPVARLVCATMLHWPAYVVLADTDRLKPDEFVALRNNIEKLTLDDYCETRYRGALTYAYWFERLKDAERVADTFKLPLHANRFSKTLVGAEQTVETSAHMSDGGPAKDCGMKQRLVHHDIDALA